MRWKSHPEAPNFELRDCDLFLLLKILRLESYRFFCTCALTRSKHGDAVFRCSIRGGGLVGEN